MSFSVQIGLIVYHSSLFLTCLHLNVNFVTDASSMDWSTVYANALAQMLSDKNLAGGSGASRGGDVITLPQHRSTVTTTTQQPATSDVTDTKPGLTSQLKSLLQATQSASSQKSVSSIMPSTDLLTAALHSQSSNHTLSVPGGGATSPNSQTKIQTSPSHLHSTCASPGEHTHMQNFNCFTSATNAVVINFLSYEVTKYQNKIHKLTTVIVM